MTTGRTAPRYETMALLYPRSQDLRAYLCEYFIVSVTICRELVRVAQRSLLSQLKESLADSNIKTYQSDLDHWAVSIKDEVHILTVQKIGEEAAENSRFRAKSNHFWEVQLHQQRMKAKLRILDACTLYDHESSWKRFRIIGNASVFKSLDAYRTWKSKTTPCTLLLRGKLGSGKSVLLSNIVDDLMLGIQDSNLIVAYFFCQYDTPRSLETSTVLGSLARQILRHASDLTKAADSVSEVDANLNWSQLLGLIQGAIPKTTRVFFVLDGLDECEAQQRNIIIDGIRELRDVLNISLCISSRLEAVDSYATILEHLQPLDVDFIPDHNPDIENFIASKLTRCINAGELAVGAPELILEIHDTLSRGAQGMFLWVALQIDSLCFENTDESIRQALLALPKDLSETFTRILKKASKLGEKYQGLILQLIMAARRPLSIEELREALSVVPGDTLWNPAKQINNIYATLACCGSIVTIDEEDLAVRLIHHSVQQYLCREYDGLDGCAISMPAADRAMADTIITYLSYGVFETKISKNVVPQIISGPVPSTIISSTLRSMTIAQGFALKLLKYRKTHKQDIGKILAEMRGPAEARTVQDFHFHDYARSFVIEHASPSLLEFASNMLLLLLKLCEGGVPIIANDTQEWRPPHTWNSEQGYSSLLTFLPISGEKLKSHDSDGRTALSWAVEDRHYELVCSIAHMQPTVLSIPDRTGHTPLFIALKQGDQKVIKVLQS